MTAVIDSISIPIPTVRAERYGEYGLRVRCPHCRRVHGHGTAGDPGPEYGHRASDCDGPGYYIVAGGIGSTVPEFLSPPEQPLERLSADPRGIPQPISRPGVVASARFGNGFRRDKAKTFEQQ